MIRLLGPKADADIDDLVGLCLDEHRSGGRHVLLNMVVSLDGATAIGGETAPLSDHDDRALFVALRAAVDVILVGAGTVRAENYGPVRLPPAAREARRSRGLPTLPRLAVVSASLDLDPHSRLFGDPATRPYLFTGEDSPPERREQLSARSDVLVAGGSRADPQWLLESLWEQGHEVVLCEGGPTLNGELVSEDLVDEVNLTLSPLVVGGASPRFVDGASVMGVGFRLERLMAGERMLFARYLRDRP